MFFRKKRIRLVRSLIEINEKIFFYSKLKTAYTEMFKKHPLNIVIDIGVNRGQTINFVKKFNKNVKIIGFEPNKELYALLKKRNYKNLSLLNCGCSNFDGKLIFNQNILDESSTFENVKINSNWLKKKALILGVKPDKLIQKTYPVEVIQLANYINKKIKEPTIDLIKIDVEGHELKVLEGLYSKSLNSKIRYIQVEVHNDDLYGVDLKNKIINLLKLVNFEIYKEVKHGFGNFHDIIFINNNLRIK